PWPGLGAIAVHGCAIPEAEHRAVWTTELPGVRRGAGRVRRSRRRGENDAMTDLTRQIVVKEFKRRGRFDMYLDGRYLGRSTTPLLTAARILLAEGLPPETAIEMRHEGSTTISLRSTIGSAAKLGVSGDRFVEYQGGKAVGAAKDEEIEAET